MRVLMLGWEFPPFISGGLGTACFGLTKALSRQHVEVLFVLPRDPGADATSHVRLLSATPQAARAAVKQQLQKQLSQTDTPPVQREIEHDLDFNSMQYDPQFDPQLDPQIDGVQIRAVPSRIVSPYQSAAGRFHTAGAVTGQSSPPGALSDLMDDFDVNAPMSVLHAAGGAPQSSGHYDGDLMTETRRYAAMCVAIARSEAFDVIHAHDWMTYPAGLAVAAATGKPLVVHVHSTEFDRSGDNVNQVVYDIERRGMHGACRVICVSYLTRSAVQHRYGVNPSKIEVVYNGVENGPADNGAVRPKTGISRGDKIVLFLGRITMQKGPEYFVGAAKKVLEKFDRVKFVMAGTGDKIRDVIELAAAEGIGHKVLFTGFLRKNDVERVFRMADVYVMPSVSEPFGIAPLEAISNDVPVIISKTSGVAEVLTHALKVDFWDTHEIANKILAVLRHPPLSNTLREYADMEVRQLTWDGAATKCMQTYERSLAMVPV